VYISLSSILREDPNKVLTHRLFLSKVDQQSILNEALTSYSDQIQFDDNHHFTMNCSTQEYLLVKKKLNLFFHLMLR